MMRPCWSEEKATTVDPPSITAYGITISSRWGKASEIERLIRIARAIADARADEMVESIFLDSNYCSFTFVLSAGSYALCDSDYFGRAQDVWRSVVAMDPDEESWMDRIDFVSIQTPKGKEIDPSSL